MAESGQSQRARKRLGLFALLLFAITVVAVLYFRPLAAAAAPASAFQTPEISLSATSFSVNEGNSINIIVQINTLPSSTMTVTVDYATSGGTAVPNTDFTPASGVLTFTSSSATTQQVSVETLQNSNSLSTATVNFTLSNPVNATTNPTSSSATIFILNTDATATPTPTSGSVPIFADAYEPNNSFNEATNTDAGAGCLAPLTFYPPGDEDYFRWWGQAGVSYDVQTQDLSAGLDTFLRVYDPNLNLIGDNDDETTGSGNSRFQFTAGVTGFYYARVNNTTPTDPVNKTYCFRVDSFVDATPTPPAAFPGGADECEYNSTIEFSCLIVAGQTYAMTFVPTLGSTQDTDFYRLWLKPGITTSCETTIPAGSPSDTNMIMYDGNGNPFNPWLGNDDKAVGDFGSKLEYLSTYTGWLFVEVGPVNVPPLSEAAQYTYTLVCTQTVATPTPTPTNTSPPVAAQPPSLAATPTPIATLIIPTQLPTPTAINPADFIPTAVPPPLIDVLPLPTSTPASGGAQVVSIQVTLFYDSNSNYLPELTEGIMDTAVALYDNATGELLSFGNTNEAGVIRFESIEATGTVRIVVPYLNYSQVVTQTTDEILIRVAPGTLPIGIP